MGELDGRVAVLTAVGSEMVKASVKVFGRVGARVVAVDVSGAIVPMDGGWAAKLA